MSIGLCNLYWDCSSKDEKIERVELRLGTGELTKDYGHGGCLEVFWFDLFLH